MSGFEIAGLALGAFPLVLECAKELDGLAKKFEFYWEFRTKFESFIDDLNLQRIIYDLNVTRLLASLDISDAERRKLQSGTEPSLWDEEHIETEIRRNVKSDHYHWLICRFRDVAVLLKRFRELLPVEKARFLDSNDIESAVYRLATSFSTKKDELLANLKKHNDDIHRYLEASKTNPIAEPPSRPSFRDQDQWKEYQKLQNQAQGLFNSFQEHWSDNCACSTGHPCGITTQKLQEVGKEHARIMLMFNPLSDDQGSQLRLRVGEDAPLGGKQPRSLAKSNGSVIADEEDGLDALSQRVFASNVQRKLKPRRKVSIKSVWRRLSHRSPGHKPENGNGKQKDSELLTEIDLSSSVSSMNFSATVSSSQQNL
ncbi:hypothetical protein GCG54_00009903 [Colletotrichum gloeosporioides]|uniref:Uncharacterized protein n=1 Tax=Colletotrichum gloeosporioides TaxID=474922 RepID=A0A8H4CY13_COLGL|nr:uncharacterized protein GCG54_00009903 [Colletotrichum gloeosporioides]KAF3812218.1 hypothetical protein GCG54_00009903 [Colletotrichum gloeosporioides]